MNRTTHQLNSSLMRYLCGCVAILLIGFESTPASAQARNDIDDSSIEIKIEAELRGAKAVDANNIDVSVTDGIVTLSGNVNNILSKEAALRIAKMTKGAQSVINRLEVEPEQRTDSELRRAVSSALLRDPATDSWEIEVEANGAVVTLEGDVESYAERELAGKIAKSIRGVRKVENNIGVTYAADRKDYEIETDVEQRLKWDVRLDDESIRVKVNGGKVTLSGSVGTAYEKTLARQNAWVAGVTSVDDAGLSVTWWSRDDTHRRSDRTTLSDADVRKAIKRAFLYDPRVQSFNPTISVNNGVVTLTGVVANLKAKRAAAQDAQNTVGVRRVQNYLKVRPLVARSDAEIEQDVKNAFVNDSFIDSAEITANVYRGELYLYGEVESYYEREHAEDVAITVNGVKEVHNYLSVPYGYPGYTYYSYYDWDPTLYDYDYDYVTTRIKQDYEIKEDIDSELWWSPWVSYDDVTVTVNDGVATLTGTVDTWSERRKATENAIEGGAVKVVNKLKVRY